MLYQEELGTLSAQERQNLDKAVQETVVVVRHPIFGGGYDVWWRDDYVRFQSQNPGLTAHFQVEAATVESAWEYLELVDRELWHRRTQPLFTVWPLDSQLRMPVANEEDEL